ncbi:MAG: DUF3854 domain-containing protein [Acidobacteria bacterium]|nr:DUF3854 domain-containing protein [Acidobacteriota bacterium]
MRRVKKSHPCPICGKPDWCLFSVDGKVALCTRIFEGAITIKTARDGTEMGMHLLEPGSPIPKFALEPPPPPLAPLSLRHEVYQALIEISPARLYPNLVTELLSRGFSRSDCTRFGALPASVADRSEVVKWLLAYLAKKNIIHSKTGLDYVPGFWRDKDQITLWHKYHLKSDWLLIPYYSPDGFIQALQYRRETTVDRYGWINSKKHPFGSSAGKLVHYCQPFGQKAKVAVVEGALKGEIYAKHFPQHDVICIDGVNTGHEQVLAAASQKPLYIAFDQDYKTNPQVFLHLKRLIEKRQSDASGPTFFFTWPDATTEAGKGIDDALLSQLPLTLKSAQEILSHENSCQNS